MHAPLKEVSHEAKESSGLLLGWGAEEKEGVKKE